MCVVKLRIERFDGTDVISFLLSSMTPQADKWSMACLLQPLRCRRDGKTDLCLGKSEKGCRITSCASAVIPNGQSCKIPSLWWMSNLHHDRKITPPWIKPTFLWHCWSFPAQADNNTALTFVTFHLGYLQFPCHPCGWKFLKLTWWANFFFCSPAPPSCHGNDFCTSWSIVKSGGNVPMEYFERVGENGCWRSEVSTV